MGIITLKHPVCIGVRRLRIGSKTNRYWSPGSHVRWVGTATNKHDVRRVLAAVGMIIEPHQVHQALAEIPRSIVQLSLLMVCRLRIAVAAGRREERRRPRVVSEIYQG